MDVATAFIANKAGNPLAELAFPFPARNHHTPRVRVVENEKNKYQREVKHKWLTFSSH